MGPLGTGNIFLPNIIPTATADEDQIQRRWDIKDITIVYLNGSFYEMGYQLGELISSEIEINKRAFLSFYENEGIDYDDLVDLWNVQKPYVSNETIDYIQGTADALQVPFCDVACVWVAEGASYCRCSSIAAWGDATSDGKLIHARSLEFPLSIKDPKTNCYIQDSPIIVIANPDDERYNAFMYPTFAGYVVEDGINEKGIAVSNMWSPNNDQTEYGTPMGIRLFECLFGADTIQKAIDIITQNKTFGYNFIVSDAKIPIAYAVETTATKVYTGTWNDPYEDIFPFWKINHVVRRTNCYLSPELAETQRDYYNPNHISYWLSVFDEHPDPWVVVWYHFKSLSKGIMSLWGDLNVNRTVFMMRQVYHGAYDPVWNIVLRQRTNWTTWWQWVACPSTGELKISFADGAMSAHKNTVFSLNLLETIKNHRPV
jgi:hypothetical protein